MKHSRLTFERMEKALYAVYQTIYSNVDIEMWFDWEARLNDTLWSEDCYILSRDGDRIGGAIISDGRIAFPFLIPPYADRCEFFELLHIRASEVTSTGTIATTGMVAGDVAIFQSLGYRILRTRKGMIRPTDEFEVDEERYSARTPRVEDAQTVAGVLYASYAGGIDYGTFGIPTMDDCVSDAQRMLDTYARSHSVDQSCIIYQGDQPVAACLIGCDPGTPNGFTGVYDIGVIADYRRQGIAEFMIRRALTIARRTGNGSAMRLFVTVGNPAESLYRKLGFTSGPAFSPMVYQMR